MKNYDMMEGKDDSRIAVRINRYTVVLVKKEKYSLAYEMKLKKKYENCTGRSSIKDMVY